VRRFLAILAAIIAVACIGLFWPRSAPPPNGPAKLQVAATVFPLADWLRQVGGEDVEVQLLVGGSANPHHFDPAINAAARVSQCRAVFAVGLGLDEWAERLAHNASNGKTIAFHETGGWITPRQFGACTKHGTPRAEGVEVEVDGGHAHGHSDPHFWLDPARARTVVLRLAQELAALDPPHAEAYRSRAEAYAEHLNALDAEVAALAKQLPRGAQLVTFHDAFGYLFDRLGVTVAAVVQASPGVEPGTRDVSDAVRTMRRIGQRIVFREPMESGVAAQAVARELGATVEILDPLDSEASAAGTTYLERMRHNLKVLGGALQGASEGK
jgi:ABC-type Zn uptake system ZnuABC Zn-binding protein ZnuA